MDLLLSIILISLALLSSSKSTQIISFLGVIIDSTFLSSSLKTLLIISSSSFSIVPSSLPSSINNSISSSVTIDSDLLFIPMVHKTKSVDLARTALIGLQTFESTDMLLANFKETFSGLFRAITFGTISPITKVK